MLLIGNQQCCFRAQQFRFSTKGTRAPPHCEHAPTALGICHVRSTSVISASVGTDALLPKKTQRCARLFVLCWTAEKQRILTHRDPPNADGILRKPERAKTRRIRCQSPAAHFDGQLLRRSTSNSCLSVCGSVCCLEGCLAEQRNTEHLLRQRRSHTPQSERGSPAHTHTTTHHYTPPH